MEMRLTRGPRRRPSRSPPPHPPRPSPPGAGRERALGLGRGFAAHSALVPPAARRRRCARAVPGRHRRLGGRAGRASRADAAMIRLRLSTLPLAGLLRLPRQPLADGAGAFARMFCALELLHGMPDGAAGVSGASPGAAGNGPPYGPTAWLAPPAQIAQINHSHTALRGTLRGLHYQRPPHAEGKLVSCLRGAVWDVALDLRQGSPTFLHWHAECLSADNGCALLI